MRGIIALLSVTTCAVALWLHSQDYMPLMERLIASTIAGQAYAMTADDTDTRILFCGTGSPNRSPERSGPCLALVARGELFLFDAGEGAIGKLREYQAPVLKLSKIFLTHLHSDHMSGVPEVLHNTWLFGRLDAVELVGPPGTGKFLDGMRLAYEDDVNERMHVLGPDGVDPELAFARSRDVEVHGDGLVMVHEDGDFTIEAFRVDHPHWPFAYGYRIQIDGRTVVVSGDTTPSDGVRRHARNADLLIHEAFNQSFMSIAGEQLEKIDVPISAARIERIAEVHTATLELADIAAEAEVKSLVLTHLIPPIPDNFVARRAFVSGMADRYAGKLTVAHDGLWLDLAQGQ